MAKLKKVKKKAAPRDGAYLTKRVMERAINKATRNTARDAMALQGFRLVKENGWVVKIDRDGNKTQVEKLSTVKAPKRIALD